MNLLDVKSITKTYRGNSAPAVKDASFELAEGKLLALVGESGSGKTTLLRILAGLETPDEGEILLDGNLLSGRRHLVPPERRGIGLVFQHHALFPHLTVGKNIAFGIRKLASAERRKIIAGLLDLIGLPAFENRFPHQLSGGERQRVALARALAPNPRLLLLDEPFSSLDARLRQNVRDETRAILKQRGATAIFVTHDTSDALSIADGLVVLRNGVIQQTGAPPEVYHAPANPYVASFFGSCNFLPFHSLPHPNGARILCHIGPPDRNGLWIRPEDLELSAPSSQPPGTLAGTIRRVGFCGAYLDVFLECQSPGVPPFQINVRHQAPFAVSPGETWAVIPKPKRSSRIQPS